MATHHQRTNHQPPPTTSELGAGATATGRRGIAIPKHDWCRRMRTRPPGLSATPLVTSACTLLLALAGICYLDPSAKMWPPPGSRCTTTTMCKWLEIFESGSPCSEAIVAAGATAAVLVDQVGLPKNLSFLVCDIGRCIGL